MNVARQLQAAQGGAEGPIPGSFQGPAGWWPEQPQPGEDNSAPCRALESPFQPKAFHDFMCGKVFFWGLSFSQVLQSGEVCPHWDHTSGCGCVWVSTWILLPASKGKQRLAPEMQLHFMKTKAADLEDLWV